MRRISILLTIVVMLAGFVFVIGCESSSTSAKATGEQEVIQASAYAEGAEAMKACEPGCDKEPSTCPKADSGCPKAAAASGCCSK